MSEKAHLRDLKEQLIDEVEEEELKTSRCKTFTALLYYMRSEIKRRPKWIALFTIVLVVSLVIIIVNIINSSSLQFFAFNGSSGNPSDVIIMPVFGSSTVMYLGNRNHYAVDPFNNYINEPINKTHSIKEMADKDKKGF